ncbi:MAG: sulfotransferase [Bacteroidota bacterium]
MSIQTRYIILGLARSGTTVTHFALMGHPNVSALNDEVKVSFFTDGISTFTQRNDNQREKDKGFIALFDAITSIFANENTRALGLKCIPDSPKSAKDLVGALKKHFIDHKIIITVREDLVAQLGSLIRADTTGNWHSWRQHGKEKELTIVIKKSHLKKYIYTCLEISAELKKLHKTHDVLEFYYEKNFLNNSQPDFIELFDFLNLPRENVTWLKSEKVAPAPELYIKNYAKLKRLHEEIK